MNVLKSMSGVTYVTYAMNKAGYTAILFALGWAGSVMEKFTKAFGQG